MNIAEAKQHIKDSVEAYLQKNADGSYCIDPSKQRPIFLLGAPGIGKTAVMSQVAQELQIGMVSYSMTHHTRQSALGLPMIVHRNFEGYEYESSEYTMSEIVASVYDYMQETGLKSGILFLDEINCVSETLYPSMLQFLQFKTFGRHRVPADWIVVCAGNPPEYNKSVHEFDIVTLDRLRKLEVQPDYAAWRTYALEKGLHPAILSFLEVKKDCFYCVESSPSGKRFVTARGWEDLSEIITLYEQMGKPVSRSLIEQFLQEDDIAQRFSAYYTLFEKYRSDYQIDDILAGQASAEIKERAQAALFDERLALLGLLLDKLAGECGDVLLMEELLGKTRDVLRACKEELLQGASLDEGLEPHIAALQAKLEMQKSAGTLSSKQMKVMHQLRTRLQTFKSACLEQGLAGGAEAFQLIQERYRACVLELEQAVSQTNEHVSNVFAFVDDCFESGREALVFTAEIAARSQMSLFVGRFGNDSFNKHNEGLQASEHRKNLEERVKQLDLDATK